MFCTCNAVWLRDILQFLLRVFIGARLKNSISSPGGGSLKIEIMLIRCWCAHHTPSFSNVSVNMHIPEIIN